MDTDTDARRYFARWEDLVEFLCNAIEVPWEGDVSLEITMETVDHKTDHERNERPE
ncbi:MAG TPA: hypothetical protein VK879_05595 [Candidatus Sulfomarinibacteraceae bacterium]|nr:hypothetical protein [Candidatus Sulfomarinibacteraceae bacterium]